jgi:hypothetical protein
MYASHAPRRACAHGRKDVRSVGKVWRVQKCMIEHVRTTCGFTHHRMRYNAGRRVFTRALGENTQRVRRV